MKKDEQVVKLMLPWYTPEGKKAISGITLANPNGVDKRLAKRVIRRFYKHQMGRSIRKEFIEHCYKSRIACTALTEAQILEGMHDMARRTYEENNQSTDPHSEESSTEEAGV